MVRASRKTRVGGMVLLCAGSVGCPAPSQEPSPQPSPTASTPSASANPASRPQEAASPASTPASRPQEAASPTPSPQEATLIKIEQSFTGRVSVGGPEPGDAPPPYETLVVRSKKSFAWFRSSIPKKRIQRPRPAPPSDDPLLKDPQFDFSTHSMIVIQRPSMYVGPTIERIEKRGNGAHVLYRLPPLGETAYAAAVIGVGSYVAVLVPKIEGEVSFELLPNPPAEEKPR